MMLTEFERTPHMSTYMLEMLLTEDHIYVNRTWENKQVIAWLFLNITPFQHSSSILTVKNIYSITIVGLRRWEFK